MHREKAGQAKRAAAASGAELPLTLAARSAENVVTVFALGAGRRGFRDVNERRLHILASPGFLVGLSLLLLNDLVLKQTFHNGLTGKLSDVAGLFVFPLFWAAFFPRLKVSVYALTAALFVYWKSAYAQPLIEVWNGLPFFPVERTVDYGDLFALLVLPFSYAYGLAPSGVRAPRPALYLIAAVSLFAFTATQYSQKVAYDNEYQFPGTRKQLMERMSRVPANDVMPSFWEADAFTVLFRGCTGRATVSVGEKENQSLLSLRELEYGCPSEADKRAMLEYFEKEFINKLRDEPATKSSEVMYILPLSSDDRRGPTPRPHDPPNPSPRR